MYIFSVSACDNDFVNALNFYNVKIICINPDLILISRPYKDRVIAMASFDIEKYTLIKQ